MNSMHRISLLSGLALSLIALSAQAQQHDPTMNIIPDPASDHLAIVDAEKAAPQGTAGRQAGLETAKENLADAKAMAETARENAEAHAADATEAAAQALANAPTPDELPAVPDESVPADPPADLPTPPAGEPGV